MPYEIERTTIEPEQTAAISVTCPWAEISQQMGPIFGEVMAYLGPIGAIAGDAKAFGRYTPAGDQVVIEAGFTVHAPIAGHGRVQPGTLPGGEAIVTIHEGSYETLSQAYEAMQAWLAERQLAGAESMWEYYLTPPDVQPPRTMLVWPLASAPVTA